MKLGIIVISLSRPCMWPKKMSLESFSITSLCHRRSKYISDIANSLVIVMLLYLVFILALTTLM